MEEKGWHFIDYDFEDLYDVRFTVIFEYQGKEYRLSCESDQCLYETENYTKLWEFHSKEEFYNGVIFGRPIKDVIDDSYMISLE